MKFILENDKYYVFASKPGLYCTVKVNGGPCATQIVDGKLLSHVRRVHKLMLREGKNR